MVERAITTCHSLRLANQEQWPATTALYRVTDQAIPTSVSRQIPRAVWIVLGRLTLVVSSVISVRVMTELLTPNEVGRMSLALSIYQWFGFLLVSPVGLFVLRHANAWTDAGVLLPNLRRMTVYFGSVSVVTALIVAFAQSTVGLGLPMSPAWLAWVVAGHLLFVVLVGTNAACLNNLSESFWFVALGNLGAWGGIAAGAVLCWTFAKSAEFWLTGILAGLIVSTALSWLLLWRTVKRFPHKPESPGTKHLTVFSRRALFAFAGPIVPITLVYWCQTDGFRFIAQHQVGSAKLGLFLVAFTLGGTPILAAERLLIDFLSPDFYRRIAEKNLETMAQAWNDYTASLIPSVIVAVAFVASAGPLLARLLLSSQFESVGQYAVYGAVFRGTFTITSAFLLWTHAVEKTSAPLPAYVAGGVVSLAGVFLGAPLSAINGIGMSLIASSLVTFTLVALTIQRKYPVRVPLRRLALAAFVSIPMVAGALILDRPSNHQSRSVIALLILPLALYCAISCALFSRLFGPARGWRWALDRLSGKRLGADPPLESEREMQTTPTIV